MANIMQRQQMPETLQLQAAGKHFYARAKWIQRFRVGVDTILAVIGPVAVLLEPEQWISQRHGELGYKLKKRVKLLKKWNASHSKRLASWHLEVMVATIFKSMSGNNRDGLMKFFEWAPSYISVQDPDGYGGDLSYYLTSQGRSNVIESLNSAYGRAVKARDAELAGDHPEAIRLWRIILGDDFPTYG